MSKISAGILLYQAGNNPYHIMISSKNSSSKEPFFLLGHYGGPFFEHKDLGTWTIPKGEVEQGEDYLQTALREFTEETSIEISSNAFLHPLDFIKQKSGKTVFAWAYRDTDGIDIKKLKSNMVELEYPPKSGNIIHFPEIDRYEFFNYDEALLKINAAQKPFIEKTYSLIIADHFLESHS